MERVTGIGGVFVRARDPQRLPEWYRAHLGVEPEPDGDAVVFDWTRTEGPDRPGTTTWALFPSDTTYLGGAEARFMVNYRVADLDAMLDQLREAEVEVDDRVEESTFGRATDPEGNRFEPWEPPPGH
jgi:catechol 2,3-dioxygenase-like lactoylglutathione lyase family enzyme